MQSERLCSNVKPDFYADGMRSKQAYRWRSQ